MTKKIAILGATSHIAKGLIYFLNEEQDFSLSLFSRNPAIISEFLQKLKIIKNPDICDIKTFASNKYDVIINCIGVGNPEKLSEISGKIFDLTEQFDNIILSYLQIYPESLYINISSGAVYGKDFSKPASNQSACTIDINEPDYGTLYSIAKINSECKHRAHSNFNIVDLRVFNYFSRFINIEYKYLLSEIIKSIKKDTFFQTSSLNVIRDYVHPYDLTELLKCCIKKRRINVALDVYSKAPIEKFLLIDWFIKEYGLKINIQKYVGKPSPTGVKINYYSKCKKAENYGYFPKYTSLKTIECETKKILANL